MQICNSQFGELLANAQKPGLENSDVHSSACRFTDPETSEVRSTRMNTSEFSTRGYSDLHGMNRKRTMNIVAERLCIMQVTPLAGPSGITGS